ncbi:signal peptide, CUB and EGF-like domain-containing protein 1 [Xiphophorus couchianus]|uniref:signal peptide, CUB and EGF-like domain-containing protein 1 n=1 Tax=Xiphophorus couchianus TaxID=32473 RepID=UPI001015EC81|nr:signal peptide, CUB and EGF-like domain-containing protein 1 [Xiphophorus couchianus]
MYHCGTYSDQLSGEDVKHCRPCEAGSFCSRAGLSKPQGLCDPGHYCTSGATTSSPVSVATGDVCPSGYFCLQGTKFPQQYPCPVGTWSISVGGQNLSSCWACPPGFYCNNTGLSQPSGLCDTGYYCSGGAKFSKPSDGLTGDICPAGHYCPLGSTFPIPCPDGTYSNSTGITHILEKAAQWVSKMYTKMYISLSS